MKINNEKDIFNALKEEFERLNNDDRIYGDVRIYCNCYDSSSIDLVRIDNYNKVFAMEIKMTWSSDVFEQALRNTKLADYSCIVIPEKKYGRRTKLRIFENHMLYIACKSVGIGILLINPYNGKFIWKLLPKENENINKEYILESIKRTNYSKDGGNKSPIPQSGKWESVRQLLLEKTEVGKSYSINELLEIVKKEYPITAGISYSGIKSFALNNKNNWTWTKEKRKLKDNKIKEVYCVIRS